VHPNAEGYFLLSKTWYAALRTIPFPSTSVREGLQTPVTDSLLRAAVSSTPLDAEFGAQIMEKLMHRWPFESGPLLAAGIPQGDNQRIASLFITGTLRWNEAHYEMADAFLTHKKFDEAVKEYEAVSAYYPDDPFALTRMGDMYALLGKNEHAVNALQRALDINETQFLHLKLGVLFATSAAPERALLHLSRAFEIDSRSSARFSRPQFEEAAYYYSVALFRCGRNEEAQQTLALLLQNNPGNEKARQLWNEMKRR
jgi:tetratricopeptide (TPR) repeat protein